MKKVSTRYLQAVYQGCMNEICRGIDITWYYLLPEEEPGIGIGGIKDPLQLET